MDINQGQLETEIEKPQKSSSLIGQLATVQICDWQTKDKQIYELSSLIFMVF